MDPIEVLLRMFSEAFRWRLAPSVGFASARRGLHRACADDLAFVLEELGMLTVLFPIFELVELLEDRGVGEPSADVEESGLAVEDVEEVDGEEEDSYEAFEQMARGGVRGAKFTRVS